MTFSPDSWNGAWIGQDWRRDAYPIGGSPVALRYDFDLPGTAQTAVVRVSAWPRYALWVNGIRAGHGPARSYPERLAYDEIDIASYLRASVNHIAVLLTPPTGVTGYSVVGRLGFILDGFAQCDDEVIPICSDASWRSRSADWYVKTGLLIALPIGLQEHEDANLRPVNWKTASVDDEWGPVLYLGPAGTLPWRILEPRTIDLLGEDEFDAPLVWQGNSPRDLLPLHSNIATRFNEQGMTGSLLTKPISSDAWLDTKEFNTYVFDFGRTRLTRPGLQVEAATDGVRLEVFYDLQLLHRPTADVGFNGSDEGACDSFTPDASQRHSDWDALLPRGFRFMTVRVVGGDCRFKLASKTVDYPYPANASMNCDDAFVQRVWQISEQTLRSSTNDAIVDTCSRENMLWTIDACVAAKAAFYTFGETRMWARCLRLIAQGISIEGVPSSIVPSSPSFMTMYDQALAFVESCREYWMATADMVTIAEVAPALLRLLTRCEKHLTPDDLFVPPDGSWHWIDWAPMNHSPYALAANGVLLRAAQAGKLLGTALTADSPDGTDLSQVSARITERLKPAMAVFYDKEKECYRSNITPSKPIHTHGPFDTVGPFVGDRADLVSHDLHGNSLAVTVGAGSLDQRRNAVNFVAHCLQNPTEKQTRFGPGWTEAILAPLWEYDNGDTAMNFVRSIYGGFLASDAPTWGEHFDGAPYNTAHAWGACVNTLLVERVCGLRPLEPGWRKVGVEPHLEDLTDLRYQLKTPSGLVAIRFSKGVCEVSIPEGIAYMVLGEERWGTGNFQRIDLDNRSETICH